MEFARRPRAIWLGLLAVGLAATTLAACGSHHRVATSTSTTTVPSVSTTTARAGGATTASKTRKAASSHSTGRPTTTTKPTSTTKAKATTPMSTASAGSRPKAPVGSMATPAHPPTTRPHVAPPTTLRTVPPTTAPPTTVHHQTVVLTISNFAFSPPKLTIEKGTTVEVINRDTTTHTWTSCVEMAGQCKKSGVWDSGDLVPGASYSFTFNNAATYMYECTIHTFMTGTITVNLVPTIVTSPQEVTLSRKQFAVVAMAIAFRRGRLVRASRRSRRAGHRHQFQEFRDLHSQRGGFMRQRVLLLACECHYPTGGHRYLDQRQRSHAHHHLVHHHSLRRHRSRQRHRPCVQ